jgi:hypothetical protein
MFPPTHPFVEQRKHALFSYFPLVRLCHRGVQVLANEDEKLAFFSESRPRVPAFVPSILLGIETEGTSIGSEVTGKTMAMNSYEKNVWLVVWRHRSELF